MSVIASDRFWQTAYKLFQFVSLVVTRRSNCMSSVIPNLNATHVTHTTSENVSLAKF